ncbi:hypothetical protein G210_3880, partial [Candida maltosa Xu316]
MNIYSSVVIIGDLVRFIRESGSLLLQDLKYSAKIEFVPEFESLTSLIDFLQHNHLPFPKYVRFFETIDIILTYDTNPSILEDCIIETDLSIFDDSSRFTLQLRNFYLQRLISLPLKIRRVEFCETVHTMMHESSVQFARKLTSAGFNNDLPLEIAFSDDRYQNLVNLAIRFEIYQEMLQHIPRSVKKLNCRILCTESGLTEFGFPIGLRILTVALIDFPNEYCLNLSNLEELVDLEFFGPRNREPTTFYNFNFPKSLKSVNIFALDMEVITNQCPELTSLKCKRVRHAENKDNFFNFPEKLTDLNVDIGVLERIEQCENEPLLTQVDDSETESIIYSTSINLPKGLQSLHVVGYSWVHIPRTEFSESQTLFSNKEENILHNLTSMKLTNVKSNLRLGPIPQSLTHLEFISSDHRMKSLDIGFFENLKNLTNLKLLKIKCPLDSCFDYELPPNLKCFEFHNSNLCKIFIHSESLKCLRLEGAKFNVVSSENVQIPENLCELKLSSCGISFIDESFTFPNSLQILNLDGNSLKRIPKLPPSLKSFSSNYVADKPDQIEFAELPTTLEELNLDHYTHSVKYSFAPDLSHLINLKKLHLSYFPTSSPINSFNLDILPKSLTELCITYCGIETFTGTFADFPKLEHLDLRSNDLGTWLSSSPNEFQFGATIRTIILDANQLDIGTVRSLVYKLKQKPNFRSLIVDSMPIPEDMQHLVMERYLVLW